MGIGLLFIFFSLLASTTYNVLMSQVVSQMNMTTTVQLCNYSKVCQIIQKINNPEIDLCNMLIQSTLYQENLLQCANSSRNSYSYSAEGELFPSLHWIEIPQALNGLVHMLVFLSALEFILAQAPRTMQGFLIGLWYAMQSVNLEITTAGYVSCAVFHWQYYASKTLLALLFFFPFVVVARKYKYCQLNEDVDINVQQRVEERCF